jgi:hypothetical protein
MNQSFTIKKAMPGLYKGTYLSKKDNRYHGAKGFVKVSAVDRYRACIKCGESFKQEHPATRKCLRCKYE